MQLPNDVTARKHKGSATSIEANNRVNPHKARMAKQILDWANVHGEFTMKSACRALDKFPHQISGRLAELKMNGLLEEVGRREEGCMVLRVVKSGEQMRFSFPQSS